MGANAQTSVPTFTAGQVLTAAQLNESARTGVPVAADASARDGLFGGTGEKTLAEGQLVYLEDSNIVQYYDGSNWLTLGPAPTAGLTKIVGETAFSAVSSLDVDDVFTSTYTDYRILLNYTTSTTNAVTMQLRAAGSTATGSNYNRAFLRSDTATPATGVSNSQTGWAAILESNTVKAHAAIEVYAPQLAEPTLAYINALVNLGAYTSERWYGWAMNHTLSTAYDGFRLSVGTGTVSGTYAIYGYAK
jgi:hypothetical protein